MGKRAIVRTTVSASAYQLSIFSETEHGQGNCAVFAVIKAPPKSSTLKIADRFFRYTVFLIALLALLDKLYSGAIQITDCIVLHLLLCFTLSLEPTTFISLIHRPNFLSLSLPA